MSSIEGINIGLAIVALLAAAGTLNAMYGMESCPIRWPTLLILIGALAHILSYVVDGWGTYADTLLFGGVGALLLANRRVPHCLLERHAIRASYLVGIFAGAVVIVAWVRA